ncbi:uncharacterized protein LOC108666706 [Hyalella azteca]|uniref:Uncharacterized protein LOC108666706 n=1 Tax=Hyalella azteca TaxID=294128 RepID=A0A8B7N5I4_HYAAZ|nr:uncharacterized protein LOC108666706 [Hyalella azteca]
MKLWTILRKITRTEACTVEGRMFEAKVMSSGNGTARLMMALGLLAVATIASSSPTSSPDYHPRLSAASPPNITTTSSQTLPTNVTPTPTAGSPIPPIGLPNSISDTPAAAAPTSDAALSAPYSLTSPSSHDTSSHVSGDGVGQIVLLPHDLSTAEGSKDSMSLRRVSAGLLKKEPPLLKGILLPEDIGDKILLVKPGDAGKVIDLRAVPGMDAKSRTKNNAFYNALVPKSGSKQATPNPPTEARQPKLLSRQKRFLTLRTIAVPLTIFHYLGFLPMRVPGVPYHEDPGLPDYQVYEPYNDLVYPDAPIRSRNSGYGD